MKTLFGGKVSAGLFWFGCLAAACAQERGVPASPGSPAGPGRVSLVGVEPLNLTEDLGRLSTAQWDRYLLGQIERKKGERGRFWQRDPSSAAAYDQSIAPNRERLKRYVGVRDRRTAGPMEIIGRPGHTGPLAETTRYQIWAVRWPALEGICGEGVMLQPRGEIKSFAVLLPDADQTPEMLAGLLPGLPGDSLVAQRLAESGVLVIVPVVLNRQTTYSGDDRLKKYTDQSHREWIYRQSAEMGRHVIGYEVQKILALVDYFRRPTASWSASGKPVGVAGYGEGGLLALYAAAMDPRIDVAWVSGYFQPRERVWSEPLYRNVWGLLEEFGDAEVASMLGGRSLVVEYCRGPEIPGGAEMPPWPAKSNSVVAAPGLLTTPDFSAVQAEWQRLRTLIGEELSRRFVFAGEPGAEAPFGSRKALASFFQGLKTAPTNETLPTLENLGPQGGDELERRQYRTFRELQEYTQTLARLSEYVRQDFFWAKLTPASPEEWARQVQPLRREFYENVIGRLAETPAPLHGRSRVVPEFSSADFTVHEVVLDVFADVITWGWLLLPNDLKPGEQRPVVVCQHGAGGAPVRTVASAPDPGFPAYQAFAARLAAQGFVVFAPYNPNTGTGEAFRQLQRKANLLRTSVFSIITLNHATILRWLKAQPFVDAKRIGFYGLSYGGKTAMRVPAILEDYCLSICSGDFNDYVPKMTSVRSDKASFMFSYPYETIEFDLANTFNYAEMAALIAPRPFMVEHGYKDGVAPLEWAAAEYSKVQRLYFRLGIPERTAIEYFDGPHMIHGQGTFDFLHRYLNWPKRGAGGN